MTTEEILSKTIREMNANFTDLKARMAELPQESPEMDVANILYVDIDEALIQYRKLKHAMSEGLI